MKKTETSAVPKSGKNLISFSLSLVIALAFTLLARDTSFTQAQTNVMFLLLFSIGLWLTEAVPPFAVGLFIIAFLVFTLGNKWFTTTPQDVKVYMNTFSSSTIWLMLGGFFLASAMTKTKLDLDLIRITLRVCGKNPKWVLFGMMLVTMVASFLISNTAATAMVIAALMPLILQLGKNTPVSKGLILGIPIAATTGGMGTMIGTPPNAVATGAMLAAGSPMDFVTWIGYGLPVSLVLTCLGWLVLVRIFMKGAPVLNVESQPSGQDEQIAGLKTKRLIVLVVLMVTLALWLTSPLHELSAAAVSAVPLLALTLTQVLKGEDVRALSWDTLILVAGGLSLGTGLQQTGLLDFYAGKIATLPVSHTVFFFLLAYATMLFSNIMSNTATSTVLIPLGMAILPDNKVEVAMIIGLAASTALFLPVSTPPNAIAYSTGMVEQKDLRIGGLLVGLIGPALIVLWVLTIS